MKRVKSLSFLADLPLTHVLLSQALTVLSLMTTGCALILPGHSWRICCDPAGVMLVTDTPDVRRLIADEDTREEEMNRFWREGHTDEEKTEHLLDRARHPDQYPPGRNDFLAAMARSPGIVVPSRSYCEVLDSSKSRCDTGGAVFEKIRVTTGRSRGKEGWLCGTNAQLGFP